MADIDWENFDTVDTGSGDSNSEDTFDWGDSFENPSSTFSNQPQGSGSIDKPKRVNPQREGFPMQGKDDSFESWQNEDIWSTKPRRVNDFGESSKDSSSTFDTQHQDDIWDKSNNFIDDKDDWGSSVKEIAPPQSNDDTFNQEVPQTPHQDAIPEPKQLGMKTVGLLIAGGLVLLALILMGISKISLKKTGDSEVLNTAPQSTQEVDTGVNHPRGGIVLEEIPGSTHVDYATQVLESTGTIKEKSRYLLDGQVIYCLEITIGMQNSQSIHYYCGFNVFDSVSVGAAVTVSY